MGAWRKPAIQFGDELRMVDHAREFLATGEKVAYRLLALVLSRTDQLTEATLHARIATMGGGKIALDLARLAAIFSATGDAEDAIENFNQAIEREQKSAVLWNELGAALAPVRPKEAKVTPRRALILGPSIFEYTTILAMYRKKIEVWRELPPVTRRRLSRHRIIWLCMNAWVSLWIRFLITVPRPRTKRCGLGFPWSA
jgi:tetratricopeptide (TPR) repeat protein